PVIEHIVRARLRTFGVEEHRFLQEFNDVGSEWYIYDIGGSRFEAIIFLAPLSFNQVLEEDRQANRLVEDSIYLWNEVCSNPLLARANIILFLNKIDILQKTLAAVIKLATYVPSFGSTPNDLENLTKYF
ncbi:guanine nucleotide binding protein, alpha subunit, partial [Suillus bovinus]|uniref:guanine nucleotide binding protein, alpha subunit n=1 Tax=Suillus bovinus TaxID=48563 RepID=UPI001B86D9C0